MRFTARSGARRRHEVLSVRFIERIARSVGREFIVDPDLPPAFIYREVLQRGIDLLRGIVTARALVFRGSDVTIRCKRRLKLGRLATIGKGSIINAGGREGVRLGLGANLGPRTVVTCGALGHAGTGLVIGDYSGFGENAHFGCAGGITIGRDVIGGSYVTFHSQEHVIDDLEVPIRHQGVRDRPIVIGNDVWIGARATFLGGAEVGDGCVVAAGSVVRGVFPPRQVIGGVPARVLKSREHG